MKPKFKVNDIVRHSTGSTALMKVTHVSKLHNGREHRYYGKSFYDSSVGCYESDLQKASQKDLQEWKKYHNFKFNQKNKFCVKCLKPTRLLVHCETFTQRK